jgi:hypothetical protein
MISSNYSHDEQSSDDLITEYERDCCEGCNARPYNKGRMKAETMRLTLDEVPQIAHMNEAITQTLHLAMTALKSVISEAADLPECSSRSECASESNDNDIHINKSRMAIAGIDLMISKSNPHFVSSKYDGSGAFGSQYCDHPSNFTPLIVELNNNPAIPKPGKRMSEKYKSHLQDLVFNIIKLVLTTSHIYSLTRCSSG